MQKSKLIPFVATISMAMVAFLLALGNRISSASVLESAFTQDQLMFVENVGQFESQGRFQARGDHGVLWLAEDALWLTRFEEGGRPDLAGLPGSESQGGSPGGRAVNIKLSFEGANQRSRLEPFGPMETVVTYLTPTGQFSAVPAWSGVRYTGLYPGIDLEVASRNGQLLMRFVPSAVEQAGLGPNTVALNIEGADGLRLEGDVPVLTTALGDFMLPIVSEMDLSLNASLPGHLATTFSLSRGADTLFSSPNLGTATTLLYGTYLGTSADDNGYAIAVDSSGSAYVGGETLSLTFPNQVGSYAPTHLIDAFIVKLSGDGTTLQYIVNLISTLENPINDIAIDSSGNVYAVGRTDSNDFPVTSGVFDSSPPTSGSNKAFVLKVNSSGAVDYATLLGYDDLSCSSSCQDVGNSIAVDNSGNAYVTGYTESSNFPTTAGAYDTSFNGKRDVFIAKINPTGSNLLFSTFLGGSDKDHGQAIVIDGSNNIYVTGYSEVSADFPKTTGAFGPTGSWDVIVTKLDAGGGSLGYSTVIGGTSWESGEGIVVDDSNNVYVTGYAASTDFPTTAGAYSTTFNGGATDAYVLKINAAGTGLDYSTFLGGSGGNSTFDLAWDIGMDGFDNVYVTGYTYSADFPTTADAYSRVLNGTTDVFVSHFDSAGTNLAYSTLIGGGDVDYGYDIAVPDNGEIFLTGATLSTDFPTTVGAYDISSNGSSDVFVIRLDVPFEPPPTSTPTPTVVPSFFINLPIVIRDQ